MKRFLTPDVALLFLRVTASVLVLLVHGLPKAIHYASQLDAIEDPLHFGKTLTLGFALQVLGFGVVMLSVGKILPHSLETGLVCGGLGFGTVVRGSARNEYWLYFLRMMTGRVNSRLLPLAS